MNPDSATQRTTSVSFFDVYEVQDVMTALGLSMLVSTQPEGRTLSLPASLETAIIARLERVMETAFDDILASLQPPRITIPELYSAPEQPVGTQLGFVQGALADERTLWLENGNIMLVAGAWDMVGRACETNADCVCNEPACFGPICRAFADGQYCRPE